MNREYHKWFSPALTKDMELLVFGHSGRQVLFFPTRTAHFYDYEDWKIIDALKEKIDAGLLQVFCVDSIDTESFYATISPADKIRRHLHYEQYILGEVLPLIRSRSSFRPASSFASASSSSGSASLSSGSASLSSGSHPASSTGSSFSPASSTASPDPPASSPGSSAFSSSSGPVATSSSPHVSVVYPSATGITAAGCSLGGYHAMNIALKYPQYFDRVLGMSARYDLSLSTDSFPDLFNGYFDENIYYNMPSMYLPNLTDEFILTRLRRLSITLVIGREDPFFNNNLHMDAALEAKLIPHTLHIWEEEAHRPRYWRPMVQQYL